VLFEIAEEALRHLDSLVSIFRRRPYGHSACFERDSNEIRTRFERDSPSFRRHPCNWEYILPAPGAAEPGRQCFRRRKACSKQHLERLHRVRRWRARGQRGVRFPHVLQGFRPSRIYNGSSSWSGAPHRRSDPL